MSRRRRRRVRKNPKMKTWHKVALVVAGAVLVFRGGPILRGIKGLLTRPLHAPTPPSSPTPPTV